jgi:diguanylate cyclase (GGDEF)-like protein/PAS domain S-box-containing protein
VGLGSLASTAVGAAIGVGTLVLSGSAPAASRGIIGLTWWLGDAVGVLIATPFLVLWTERSRPALRGRELESVLLFLVTAGIGGVVFFDVFPSPPGAVPLAYLCILPLLWAALRFGQREVSTGLVALSGIAIWGTMSRFGPFVRTTPNESLLQLQAFLGAVAVMSTGVGAFVARARAVEEELQRASQGLEKKVADRTLEISSANADLRQSAATFRALLESAPDGMVIVDKNERIVLVNAQTEKLFGYPRTELVGGHAGTLFPDRFRQQEQEHPRGFLAGLRVRSLGGGLEMFGRRRDGSEFPIDVSLSPLESGTGTLVVAAIRDISRRRQNEEALARLAAVVASSEDAIVSTDTEGMVTTWNDAAGRLLGYTEAEVVGRPAAVLAAPGRAAETEGALERLGRREQVRCETQAVAKDGSVVDVGLSAFPVQDRAGRLLGFSAILRDITDQKRAETERQEREVLKSQVSELSRRTHEIAALNELGDVLRSSEKLAEAYPVIPRFLRQLFPTESGALYEYNATHNLLESVLTWGDTPPPEDAFLPGECWALRRGQMHQVSQAAAEMTCQHIKSPVLTGSLCVPLMARGSPVGLLRLIAAPGFEGAIDEGGVLGEYRQRLAKNVGQQIASALYDLRMQETLRDQASRDPLTGLFNRRTMEETLDRELYRATRRATKVGFVLFDLDHFKRFNDQFGHAAGDAVLREVSSFIQMHTRAEDIVCRYGGEEFLMVLSDCNHRHLVRRAEQIRDGVRQLRIEYGQRPLGPITLSAGLALFPDNGRNLEELFQATDAALYQAKQAGRDRVVVADPLRVIVTPASPAEKQKQH